jgi:hypothetical protein
MLNANKTTTTLTLKKFEPNIIINKDGKANNVDLNGTQIGAWHLEQL